MTVCYMLVMSCMYCSISVSGVFFFKQKTAYDLRISDWSSDVCSSDLEQHKPLVDFGATVFANGLPLIGERIRKVTLFVSDQRICISIIPVADRKSVV